MWSDAERGWATPIYERTRLGNTYRVLIGCGSTSNVTGRLLFTSRKKTCCRSSLSQVLEVVKMLLPSRNVTTLPQVGSHRCYCSGYTMFTRDTGLLEKHRYCCRKSYRSLVGHRCGRGSMLEEESRTDLGSETSRSLLCLASMRREARAIGAERAGEGEW